MQHIGAYAPPQPRTTRPSERAADLERLRASEETARLICPNCQGLGRECPTCGGRGLVCPTCRAARFVLSPRRDLVRCPSCCDTAGHYHPSLEAWVIKHTLGEEGAA